MISIYDSLIGIIALLVSNPELRVIAIFNTILLAQQAYRDFERLSQGLLIPSALIHGDASRLDRARMHQEASIARFVLGTWGKAYHLGFDHATPAFSADDYGVVWLDEADKNGENEEKVAWLLPVRHQVQVILTAATAKTNELQTMMSCITAAAPTIVVNPQTLDALLRRDHHYLRLNTTGRERDNEALHDEKMAFLSALFDNQLPKVIIYCYRKDTANRVKNAIRALGKKLGCEVVHRGEGQEHNRHAWAAFNESVETNHILVSSDITHRGLNPVGLRFIINWDLPTDAISYIHRASRCGKEVTIQGQGRGLILSLVRRAEVPSDRAHAVGERNWHSFVDYMGLEPHVHRHETRQAAVHAILAHFS